ncbi:jerky protein homolog-like [Colletes gigas]|uniref:jerky protein homolog-like n=1 Tax=Colletes gigas TaxID=935657 RepID=UPI001C9B3D20|nr:jerky protein homolog-like [Colletes gigas]
MPGRQNKTRVYLTLQQRYDVLRKLEDGCSWSQLANYYNVTDSTIRRIKSNEDQIRKQLQTSEIHDQKKMRTPIFDELDARLHSWFLQRRATGKLITDIQFQQKAKQLNEEFGGPSSFSASRGWVWRFKRRHGIRLLKLHGENIFSNAKGAEEFSLCFLRRLKEENIDLQNVYNMDETGLLWKAVSQESLVHAGEQRFPGSKTKKDRVSVGLCINATGTHKLPLIFINKYEKPRVLKHCQNQLPVIFMAQKNGFMDQKLFAEWLKNHFEPAVKKHQLERGTPGKVLLLLHRCETHTLLPDEQRQDNSFEIVYFPSFTTSILQPMNQGIFDTMKKSYYHRMLKKILELPGGVEEFYKDFDIKDCIDILTETWADISPSTIWKSWEKMLGMDTLEQEARENQENGFFRAPVMTAISTPVNTNVEEMVIQQELESLSTCSETEDISDLDVNEQEGNEKSCSERGPHLDEEKIDKMFKNLLLWSKNQPIFIKIQVQALQDFYQHTRR